MIYILDLEASSLGDRSFPIEIAWVDQEERGEQHLVRPASAWLNADGTPLDWDSESERLHGISFGMLLEVGAPHVQVVRRVAEMLGAPTAMVYSDAPQADGTWIGRLLLTASIAVPVGIIDVTHLYRHSCLPLRRLLPAAGVARERAQQRIANLTKEIIAAAEEAEHVVPGIRHRALPDAQRLWRTWRGVRQAVARHVSDESLR